ncbi:acyltransferase family protein [Naasia lichenicola]|nr:acyltransferase [Naasia lichenicola]
MTEDTRLVRSAPAAQPAPVGRLQSLDGLRGCAAFVVLIHHAALLSPLWPGNAAPAAAPPFSFIWWANETPLKLLSAGTEAVMVFFVLSGLVVTLPVLRPKPFDWIAYYPRRAVRLLAPVLGSVVLAAIWVMALPQISPQDEGTWLSSSSTPDFSWEWIVKAGDLFGGDGQINNPLWTLRWEMIFSLLLPVFVILAVVLARRWVLVTAAVVLLTWLGERVGASSLSYLPAFLLGALLAVNLDRVRELSTRLSGTAKGRATWAGIGVLGGLMLVGRWLASPVLDTVPELEFLLRGLTPLAAMLIVLSVIGSTALRAFFSSPVPRFLGKISFSLYLVHAPIVIFFFYALQGRPLIVAQVVGIVVSLIVGTLFWWAFEKRAHQWSISAGKVASARFSAYLGRGASTEPSGRSHDGSRPTGEQQNDDDRGSGS